MTLKRNMMIVIMALAATSSLAGCGVEGSTTNAADADPEYGVSVVEAHLSTGPYLDCIYSHSYPNNNVLNCDWNHPRKQTDPAKKDVGTFTVYQKYLTDKRVIDCIAIHTYPNNGIADCDWAHARTVTIS